MSGRSTLVVAVCILGLVMGLGVTGCGSKPKPVAPVEGEKPAVATAEKPVVATMILQQGLNGYAGCEDVATDGDRPEENLLADRGERGLGLFGDSNGNWAFIRFSDIKIPEGKRIAKAELAFTIREKAERGESRVALHRLKKKLDFSKLTFLCRDADKKEKWGDGTKDQMPQSGIDYEPKAESDGEKREPNLLVFDVTTAVKDWVRDPAANTGVVLRPYPDEAFGWLDSTQQEQDARPKLIISLEIISLE